MSIFSKIKEAISRIFGEKRLGIPESTRMVEGPLAPKGNNNSELDFRGFEAEGVSDKGEVKEFLDNLRISESELNKGPVVFKDLEPDIVNQLVKKHIRRPGFTHSRIPTLSGELNGENFVSLKRAVGEKYDGQTICTESGYYNIFSTRNGPLEGRYEEKVRDENGMIRTFSKSLAEDNSNVYSSVSNGSVTLTESAFLATSQDMCEEFYKFAQPSDEFLREYSGATGLPIINKFYASNLGVAIKEKDPKATCPYIVSIEANRQQPGKVDKKAVKFLYTSPEAYRNGEKPYMVYLDGIDGRTGFSGMFRLTKDGKYIDNSTFSRKVDPKYPSSPIYTCGDTVSIEEIKALAGKFPTELSETAKSAITGKFRMPEAIKQIYEKAISTEKEKENPDKGIEISD